MLSLSKLGYDIDYYKLSCLDFNIPQSRPRLFILGSKKGISSRLTHPYIRITEEEKRKKSLNKSKDE